MPPDGASAQHRLPAQCLVKAKNTLALAARRRDRCERYFQRDLTACQSLASGADHGRLIIVKHGTQCRLDDCPVRILPQIREAVLREIAPEQTRQVLPATAKYPIMPWLSLQDKQPGQQLRVMIGLRA